jgi:hypothetical protein
MLNEDGVACPGLGFNPGFWRFDLYWYYWVCREVTETKLSDRVYSLHGGRERCDMAFNELIWGLEERNG